MGTPEMNKKETETGNEASAIALKSETALEFAHQNYDAVFKDAISLFKDKALDFLGLDGSMRILEALRTEKREVEVKTEFCDMTFRLSDNTGLLLEQEVDLSYDDLLRFCGYTVDLMREYKCEFFTLVLVNKAPAIASIDIAGLKFSPQIVVCGEKDGDVVLDRLKAQAESGLPINELELVYLPLFGSKRHNPTEMFGEALKVAKVLNVDYAQREKIVALLITVSNKLVDKNILSLAWEEMRMMGLKVLEVAVEKGVEKVALSMLKDGLSLELICKYTGLSRERVEELRKALPK